jgi:hypothetical protein
MGSIRYHPKTLYNKGGSFSYSIYGKEWFAMSNNELREALERLRTQLDSMDVRDEMERERLRKLEADLRARLERTEESHETDEPLLERLQESIEEFEETHPELTMALSHMMTILSNAGI